MSEAVATEGGGPEQLALELVQQDSPLTGKVKGDRNTMVFAFFSLTKEKVSELPRYDDGRTRIEVVGTRHGVATIWDKEILVYCASLLAEKMNRGEAPTPKIVFTAHDFLQATGSTTGGGNYERLEESLVRLSSTLVRTNIETGGEGEDRGFGWISDYRIVYRRSRDGKKSMRAVEVTLCDWLFRAVVKDRHLLTYTPKYFELSPLAKRLYEIARSGPPQGFRISLPKLLARVGAQQTLRRFKSVLKEYSDHKKSIPDYAIGLIDPSIRRALDGNYPKEVASSKATLVAFYPTTAIAKLVPNEQLPILEEEDDMADTPLPGEVVLFEVGAPSKGLPKKGPPKRTLVSPAAGAIQAAGSSKRPRAQVRQPDTKRTATSRTR